jgi:hypothetical protein
MEMLDDQELLDILNYHFLATGMRNKKTQNLRNVSISLVILIMKN